MDGLSVEDSHGRSEEGQTLIQNEEGDKAARDTSFRWTRNRPSSTNSYTSLPVYDNIHIIRQKILNAIEEPFTAEQLRSPVILVSTVEPLANELDDVHDISLVYCLLVNRVHFLDIQSGQTHHHAVNITRALLCELVASKILQRYDAENSHLDLLLELANVLVTDFDLFQNAPDEVKPEDGRPVLEGVGEREGSGMKSTALELAIISESKSFLSSPPCQKVIDAIHKGRIIYTPFSPIDILPDNYKRRPISIYNPRKASLLNQYRLIVPRTRYILEVCQFSLLLILYLLVMVNRVGSRFTWYEIVFGVYAFGWVLDQFASVLEHGWRVYTQNLWSFLDVMFAFTYGIYLVFRVFGLMVNKASLGGLALDILTTGAPVLVPRLAFNLMSNNMLIVALREMMADFSILSLLAVWCSAGFLLSMTWLSNGLYNPTTISKWMLWVWFGLDGTGIEKSVDFHRVLGPLLMIAFAFLGNTLFLTLLVAMLSHDFSTIVANAATENQYRRAVLTFGGVKSDSIFAYQPPFNILAVCLLLPLKLIVSPRWFHRINVAATRTLNAPLLLIICLYERKYLWKSSGEKDFATAKRRSGWGLSKFSVFAGVREVFSHKSRTSSHHDTLDIRLSSFHTTNEHTTSSREDLGITFPRISRLGGSVRRPLMESSSGAISHVEKLPTTLDTTNKLIERVGELEASNKRLDDAVNRLCEYLAQAKH